MTALRLLIVDDDADIADFIGEVAVELGFDVVTLSDPSRFPTVFRRAAPDGVVLDLAMPGADGVELIRFLGESQCRAPILLVSGFDPRVVDAARRIGGALGLKMAGILRKPATLADLQAALRKAFPEDRG